MSDSINNSNGQFPYDHVVVVVLENHGYDEIIGAQNPFMPAEIAPYINGTLVQDGLLISNAYGEQHPSQPNYHWLFSGSNQGITYDGNYWEPNGMPPGPVFTTDNLYTHLESTVSKQVPDFFAGYVDALPEVSNYSDDNYYLPYYTQGGIYANRHVPWLAYKSINKGKPYDPDITKDFSEFPQSDFDSLPLVSFVIPALNHNMHDHQIYPKESNSPDYRPIGTPLESAQAINSGDQWLKANLDGYAQWAKENNSLLIITFDEDSTADWVTPPAWGGNGHTRNPYGMTAPNLGFNDMGLKKILGGHTYSGPNHIAMIFYGANLKYKGPHQVPGIGVNNINLLRTIESFYGLPQCGRQTDLASNAGLTDGPIEGVFTFS